MVMDLPRVVIAAPGSGHGKTTVATGLMAALRRAGHVVSGHKVGPDYIDPGYHALATGRPGRNLDPRLVGEHRLAPMLVHGATAGGRADIAIIEGVMGLFDGALGTDGFASTAHVAAVLRAPVILVIDVSHASRTVGALVHGLVTYDPAIHVAGVILNKAGSTRHAESARAAVEQVGVPVVGVLARDDGIEAPSRHLGLVTVAERTGAASELDRLADQVSARIDLAAVMHTARRAPRLTDRPWDPVAEVARGRDANPVIAMAGGRAFTFCYTETRELLEAAGCTVTTFDPLVDDTLPDGTDALYLGGGFPETQASTLSSNHALREEIREAARAGMPIVAECAGMLYLADALDGAPMTGVLDARAHMSGRLTLGYRQVVSPRESLLLPAGGRAAGHEFHRTRMSPGWSEPPAWIGPAGPEGFSLDPAGTGRPTIHASYVHLHWAGSPVAAERFACAAATFDKRPRTSRPPTGDKSDEPTPIVTQGVDLRHHGDTEARPGMLDLAVNVTAEPWPGWLDEGLQRALRESRSYPRIDAARDAIAARHGCGASEILPTAGGAEAFSLIARMRRWRHPVVVHPQFTEPEHALRAAGYDVQRVVLGPPGFTLTPGIVPESADLVILGNPTNPTGRLHPRPLIETLLRPDRVVVVDEAFMDQVPGEAETLADADAAGLLVIRSLTKTWALPGVRAGYIRGRSAAIGQLAAVQPQWSVSTVAAAAMVLCCSPSALRAQRTRALDVLRERRRVESGLRRCGVVFVEGSQAPFVLAHPGEGVRDALWRRGVVVRRCDTFPGLDDAWVRIAVRRSTDTDRMLAALEQIGSSMTEIAQDRVVQSG